jgi:hypothetical protein
LLDVFFLFSYLQETLVAQIDEVCADKQCDMVAVKLFQFTIPFCQDRRYLLCKLIQRLLLPFKDPSNQLIDRNI